jgi:hypothetical protein
MNSGIVIDKKYYPPVVLTRMNFAYDPPILETTFFPESWTVELGGYDKHKRYVKEWHEVPKIAYDTIKINSYIIFK